MTIPVAGKMQPQRLTDSHCGNSDPHRGFEIMKMRIRCSRWTQHASVHWCVVNPEADASAVPIFGSCVIAAGDGTMAGDDFSQNRTQKPITAVDNAMTTT
jgi:hypothetical protein